jgi:hypothetical protein
MDIEKLSRLWINYQLSTRNNDFLKLVFIRSLEIFFLFFKTGSYSVAQDGLKFVSSFFSLLSAGIKSMSHHTFLYSSLTFLLSSFYLKPVVDLGRK